MHVNNDNEIDLEENSSKCTKFVKGHIFELSFIIMFFLFITVWATIYFHISDSNVNALHIREMFNIWWIVAMGFMIMVTIVVLILFKNLDPVIKDRVSGTWSSLMSDAGIYGSKFLLFCMAIVSFSMMSAYTQTMFILWYNRTYMMFTHPLSTWIFIQLITQPLLLAIGFFPSNKTEEDNFLFQKIIRSNANPLNHEGVSLIVNNRPPMHGISTKVHEGSAIIYGLLMLITNFGVELILENKYPSTKYVLSPNFKYWPFAVYGLQWIFALSLITLKGFHHFNEKFFVNHKKLNIWSIAFEMLFFCTTIFMCILQSMRINSRLYPLAP